MIDQKQELIQSAASYTIGGGSISMAFLIDAAEVAQALAIIFGCGVVMVRFLHDVMMFWRKWRDSKK